MILRKLSRLTHRAPKLRSALQPLLTIRSRFRARGDARAREQLDRFAALLVEDPVLRVDEFEGNFALSARGHLFSRIIATGEYEPVLTACCIDLLDSTRDVVDVGANVGFHTVLFAKHISPRRVLAIEPTRNALARLRRNIVNNHVEDNVCIFEGVASNAQGTVELKTIVGLEEYSTLGEMAHPSIHGAEFVVEIVEARTLDQLVEERQFDCGFLKVDAEGAEHMIFEGARHLLAYHRPVVLSELSDALLRKNGSSAQEIVRFFNEMGYVVRDPLRPNEAAGFREFGDILCLPNEHPRAATGE